MNIVIVSAFRNATSYISRYCQQMDAFQAELERRGHRLTLVLGYGDSVDGTGEVLFEECLLRFSARLVDVSHGGHHYGSIVHPVRFQQLAFVGNHLWKHIPQGTDIVGLVESDLIWDTSTLVELIGFVKEKFIVAPMIMHKDGRFYDRYAFIMNGKNFQNDKPFHPDFIEPFVSSRRFYTMDSVGSVLFMRADLSQKLHWPEEDVIVGLCKQARELGATIILDSYSKVTHP